MNLDDYMTIPQVEEKYNVSGHTIRAYITRKQIPENVYIKIGRQWFIKRDWVEGRYQKR